MDEGLPTVDQGGEVRAELDSAVVPSVRGQPGASVSVRSGYNLGNFLRRLCLPKAVKHWSLRSVQVKLIKMGGRLVRHAYDLSVVRGVGSWEVVPEGVGTHRPVITGAKLRERRTTILPRGRVLQGVALSSEPPPINRGPGDNKNGQRVWFTMAIVLPIGQTER